MSKPVYTDPHSQNYHRWIKENPEPKTYEAFVESGADKELRKWIEENCKGKVDIESDVVRFEDIYSNSGPYGNITIPYPIYGYQITFDNADDFTQFSLRWL